MSLKEQNSVSPTPKQELFANFFASVISDVFYSISNNPLEILTSRISRDLAVNTESRTLPSHSITKVFKHLYKHEGASVFLNGMTASMKMGVISSGLFFPIYEYSK